MLEQVKYATALHTSVNGAVSFTGTGTNNLTYSGSAFFATSRSYRVQMDSTSTYKWSNDGGSTWEATVQPIYSGLFVDLVNADGEAEGLKIRFGGTTGHVLNDRWDFTTTGQVVPSTATQIGLTQINDHCEYIILKGEYAKGSETGIDIYFSLPISFNGTIDYRPSRPTAIGGGMVVHSPDVIELDASANFSYTYETNGAQYYRLWAVKKGGTASGTFTLFHEQHRQLK